MSGMEPRERTGRLLVEHSQTYPKLQIQDLFKFLHQSAFGCEHFVSSPERAAQGIADEYAGLPAGGVAVAEPLDGAYSRVPLACMRQGLRAETFGRLFAASSKREEDGLPCLLQKLDVARELVCRGVLPFSKREFDAAVAQWRAEGYPAVHHSDAFRKAYHPAYRVLANRYVPFLPLFAQLDKRLAQGRVTLALDGGSASGKTTLGAMLAQIYDCTVLHMDDFFLRPEQRTNKRLAQVGGNVDWERFLSEVLRPLRRGETVHYRRFDCATMSLAEGEQITPRQLVVVEGAYSMHPELAGYYDLSAFLDIAPQLQRQRIQRRNTPQMARRFFEEWIPLENKYFAATDIRRRCGMTVSIPQE